MGDPFKGLGGDDNIQQVYTWHIAGSFRNKFVWESHAKFTMIPFFQTNQISHIGNAVFYLDEWLMFKDFHGFSCR